MTKPPIPENPFSDFMNANFTGTPDSLLAMMLTSTALVMAYLVPAALFRRVFPKPMDLAFALALATPITSFIVLGHMGWGLVIGAIALIIGLVLWGTARRKPSERQPGSPGGVR